MWYESMGNHSYGSRHSNQMRRMRTTRAHASQRIRKKNEKSINKESGVSRSAELAGGGLFQRVARLEGRERSSHVSWRTELD